METWHDSGTGYLVFEETAIVTKGQKYSMTVDVTEEWRIYLQEPLVGTNDEIAWFEEQIESDFSEWFTDYNGEKIHRIENVDILYKNSGPAWRSIPL